MGLITSAIMGTSMITVVIGGWLSDTWGAKKILVIVMLYIAIAVLTLSLINSFWTALLAGLLIGIGVGPFYPLTSKQIIDWLPQKTRALGMSIKQTGPPVAGAPGRRGRPRSVWDGSSAGSPAVAARSRE